MSYAIENASKDDLATIFTLFDEAILFQKNRQFIGWQSYDRAFIESDVQNKLVFKVVSNNHIAGVFSICFTDLLIWRDKEKNDAIYLHRIISNRKFGSEKLFKQILAWAVGFATERKRKYIRMDTWSENEKLIAYYKSYGFAFIENYTTPDTKALPEQHRNLSVALLEYTL